MAKVSKRMQKIRNEILTPGKIYSIEEAISLLKTVPQGFVSSLDLAVNLGVDVKKSDQVVRGSVDLPKGSGKSVRIAVFTSAQNEDAARAAGAEVVGLEDLAAKVKAGDMPFDMVLATPDAMKVVGQLGQQLGTRGMMPNPKDGTVATDIANAVRRAKMGQARYRTDKFGIVHCAVGKIDFSVSDLVENIKSIIAALKRAKPVTAKGIYFKKVTLSTTMGPGLPIDVSSLDA